MQLSFRLLYILKRLSPISVFLLEVLISIHGLFNSCIFIFSITNALVKLQQKDAEHFSSHDVLVKRVQAAFNRFAESTEQSCRER